MVIGCGWIRSCSTYMCIFPNKNVLQSTVQRYFDLCQMPFYVYLQVSFHRLCLNKQHTRFVLAYPYFHLFIRENQQILIFVIFTQDIGLYQTLVNLNYAINAFFYLCPLAKRDVLVCSGRSLDILRTFFLIVSMFPLLDKWPLSILRSKGKKWNNYLMNPLMTDSKLSTMAPPKE